MDGANRFRFVPGNRLFPISGLCCRLPVRSGQTLWSDHVADTKCMEYNYRIAGRNQDPVMPQF